MTISIKQLEVLATHFHFDMDEARQVLGIEIKKRGSPKSPSSDSGSEKGHYKPKAEKPTKEEREKKPRGPSGYNLFVREQGISFKNAGSAWKALNDSERGHWIAKAKA